MSQDLKKVEGKASKNIKKWFKNISYILGYLFIFLSIWYFVNPLSISILPNVDLATARLLVFWLLPVILLLMTATLGVLGVISWFLGLILFPISLAYDFFKILWRISRLIFKIFSNFYVIATINLSCLFCIIIGFTTDNAEIGLFISALSGMGVLFVVIRITQKAFNPLGFLGLLIQYLTSRRTNFLKKFLETILAKSEKKPIQISLRIKNMAQLLSFIFKVPKLLENPKIPLVMFLLSFVPAVFFIICMFAVMFKGLLLNSNITFSNLDYLRISIYQFTGSNFHGFDKIPNQLYWFLAAESCVAFYFSVVIILAFGLTAQIQSNLFSKKMLDYIYDQLHDASTQLPQKISEEYSQEEILEIQKVIQNLKQS